MHTLGERIQEYGVRISFLIFFNSTTQPLNTSTFWCFHPHMVLRNSMPVYSLLVHYTLINRLKQKHDNQRKSDISYSGWHFDCLGDRRQFLC